MTGAHEGDKEASSRNRNYVFHFLFQTEYKEIFVMPCATGKLRRGELGRGRNGVPSYKVTRENQSLLEWSWHWRHRNQQTVDQWAPLGGGRKEEGTRTGYCTKESVPRSIKTTPLKLQEIPLPVQMLVWTQAPPHAPFWLTASAKPRGWTCGTRCCKLINNCEFFFVSSLIHSAPLFPPQVESVGSWLSLSDNSWLK